MSDKVHAPLWLRPGGRDLELYERLGSGMLLVRAYLSQLDASRSKALLRRNENIATLKSAPPLGNEYMGALDERIVYRVLEELEPIMRALLSFCERPGPTDGQLRKLRRALRLDRGRSPYDVSLATRSDEAQSRWRTAHRQLEYSMAPKSDRAIAREIAKALGVSPRTAWTYLQRLERAEPWHAGQVRSTRATVKQRVADFRRMVDAMAARSKDPTPKPAARQRINFGKPKCATD